MKFKIEEEREVKNGTTEGNHTSSNKLRFALEIPKWGVEGLH